MWQKLGILDKVRLELNTLGTTEERLVYRDKLVTYFKQHLDQLDEDSLRRLETNPLRILDSKNRDMRQLIASAPELMDSLGDDSRSHFESLTAMLDELNVQYQINTRLVRGLDYYGKTVFEWVTDDLGAQGTICAGGRYDGLIEQLGGKANHAIGFAMGMERLLLLLEQLDNLPIAQGTDVYMIRVGQAAEKQGLLLAEKIRDQVGNIKLQVNCGGGSIKSQFKKADKSGADYALILGEDEVNRGVVSLKPMKTDQEQMNLSQDDLIQFLINTK